MMSKRSFLELFEKHYQDRFNNVETYTVNNHEGIVEKIIIKSDKVREGNYPNILYHGKKTKNAIVLIHGLTDSPYYMKDIAERFYHEGANVVLPLLSGHGLQISKALNKLQDHSLDKKWKSEVDLAVDIAQIIGEHVSIGGLSTGGALSINKILRDPQKIDGGVFLFSAALSIGHFEIIKKIPFVQPFIKTVRNIYQKLCTKNQTKKPVNPYKYPFLLNYTSLELFDIILENKKISKNIKNISQPIFAVHSLHDETIKNGEVRKFFKKFIKTSDSDMSKVLILLDKPKIGHSNLVLKNRIVTKNISGETVLHANPNPIFNYMMSAVIGFYKDYLH